MSTAHLDDPPAWRAVHPHLSRRNCYGGTYESNIDLNPLFADTAAADFSLQDPSHCIGAGFDSAGVTFDGSHLASGVYLYRLRAGELVETRRMVILR